RSGSSKPCQPDERGTQEHGHLCCVQPGESQVRGKPISTSDYDDNSLREAEPNASREELHPQMHRDRNKYRRREVVRLARCADPESEPVVCGNATFRQPGAADQLLSIFREPPL